MNHHRPIAAAKRVFWMGRSSCNGSTRNGNRNGNNSSIYYTRIATPSSRHYSSTTTMAAFDRYESNSYSKRASSTKRALVVGSSGSLGRTLTKHLAKDLGVEVIGADVMGPKPQDEVYLRGGFVELPQEQQQQEEAKFLKPAGLQDLTMALTDGLYQLLLLEDGLFSELDAVICVAGGWEGDPPLLLPPLNEDNNDNNEQSKRLSLLEGACAYTETIDTMMGKNLYPVLAAGYAAQHFMTTGRNNNNNNQYYDDNDDDDDNEDCGGLFVAIGATAALSRTPGMLGYCLSKVATHHYLQTLGETTGKALTTKSRRKQTRSALRGSPFLRDLTVVGILPTTIDTQANREAMPGANFDEWTKSMDICKQIGTWLEEPVLRPHSGSLVKVHPKKQRGGGAEFQVVR